jgi:hypothetical protein
MKPIPLPPHALEVAGVLNPTEFKAGIALWDTVCRASGADLTNCLLASGNSGRLEGLTFSVMQIAELVSAVGAQSIRARFVVLRDEGNNPRFSVAMYAAGANDVVLSSYYLARRYWLPEAGTAYVRPAALRLKRDAPKHALPKGLAEYWVASWADAERYPTSSALFTSAGQPLHGYNFALSDLMDPLRGLNAFNNQVLTMTFGLHTALNFNGKIDAPVATLGLMLRIASLTDKDVEDGGGDAFDVGMPSPPAP